MEDILASIRRILSEDEATPDPAAPTMQEAHGREGDMVHPPPDSIAPPDLLVLDPSMLLPEAASPMPSQPAATGGEHNPAASLVAPGVAAAAASSIGGMVRNIVADRAAQVHSGGPTLDDIVRAELRPLLKQWLDQHLPTMVERLVRIELERVIGRAAG